MISPPSAGAGGRQPPPATRTTALVIWCTLLAGVVAFSTIATVVGPGMRERNGAAPEILDWIALGMALLTFASSRMVPARVRPLPGAPPDAVAVTRTIIAASLNEGAALFAIVAWLVGGRTLVLIPLAVAVAGLLLAFPSAERWRRLSAIPSGAPRSPLVR